LSVLLGDEKETVRGVNVTSSIPGLDAVDRRLIFESQLGVEYIWPVCGDGYYFLRGGYEVQHWDEFVPLIGSPDHASVLLNGFFFSFGFQR